jgi:hypothetical protein
MSWKPIDVKKAIERSKQQSESTTSSNAGGFAVPFGAEPLRPPAVSKPVSEKKKKKR